MSIKSIAARLFASQVVKKTKAWSSNSVATQNKVFQELIRQAKNTQFGKDHHFEQIQTPSDFAQQVPVRDYEQLKPYVDRVVKGEENVLWKGKPLYFAKTSGTTSGAKYIPLTKESMPFHIEAARNAILHYIHETGNCRFLNGKMIFISGSPALEKVNGILCGRLSGIVNHHVPGYLRTRQLPSYATNTIEDWETKIDAIVNETVHQDMRFISGIPPWVQMYFDRLLEKSGKAVKDLFPNFDLLSNLILQ